MQELRKAGYQTPEVSFFVPGLADQLKERAAHPAAENASWQPRWTILFSLSAGMALWLAIFWLAGL
ncbi:MAG TPA: hypothetical protein VG798_04185 [Rhizomicrobium sp.]|nr:hypothetical protein [Rhizomicrobium sp.]